MAKCNDCLHYEVCLMRISFCMGADESSGEEITDIEERCKDFKNTADFEEVKYGEWIPTNDDNKKRCSRCDVIHLIAQYPKGQANCCPNCGAKMNKQQLENINPAYQKIYNKFIKESD